MLGTVRIEKNHFFGERKNLTLKKSFFKNNIDNIKNLYYYVFTS
ncbi:hypothetical protein HMPREF3213_01166 [Heyndrickxia coagulans]|uniref:Uncharacterized protein n=1 Tax=Heyndrickxia coagulans TaxID=1398 RepID=A0A133KWW6_HEYCO|nr:hypothetical protein HMPREF3213_01166 [Heyndrickxia coagulans]